MAAKNTKTKKRRTSSRRAKKWTDQHKAVIHLLEYELEGLIQYLRSVHYIAMIVIVSAMAALIYALRVLFNNDQQAVVGFLVIIVTAIAVIITASWVLRPWVLPRFLLPLDLQQINNKQLLELFKNPEEYISLLKNHLEALTDQFLVPKLRRLRNAMILLIFGVSTALLLSVALP